MRKLHALPPLAAALLIVSACKGGSEVCDPTDPLCSTGGNMPSLSIADASVAEGSGGSVNLVFDVTLSSAASSSVTVNFATSNGTAVAPDDYANTSGTLTFPAGTTSRPVTVPIYSDVFDEGADETLTLTLSAPSGATIADGSAVGTITDDDSCALVGTLGQRETVAGELDNADCSFGTGEFLEMRMLTLTGTTDVLIDQVSDEIDTYLLLWEADGTVIEEDDDDGFGLNSRIARTLTAGRYLVVASSYDVAELGTYDLSINRVFYGATAGQGVASELYTIDAATGAETLIGPIGFTEVSAIDFHPTTGVLYGLGQRASVGDTTKVLITINPATGVGTEVGPLGITSRFKVPGMSFRNDGVLFAYHAESVDHTTYTVNVTTGTATILGSTGLFFNGGNGLAFDAAGTLYHANSTETNTINQTTGAASFVAAWTPPAGCNSGRLGGADRWSGGRTIFGVLKCDLGGASTELFGMVDFPGGTFIEIGPTGAHMDALAIR